MNKKQRHLLQFRIRMGMTLISLSVALTSLAYVTYSWFMFNRTATIDALEISVEQQIEYDLKYFVSNGNEGYPSSDYELDDVDVTLSDYSSEFLPVDPDFHQYTKHIAQPGYRLTYALELTLANTASEKDYDIFLSGFTSEASTLFYDYARDEAIDIAEAIDLYSTVIDGDQTNSAITSQAATFIEAITPSGGDKFDGSDEVVLLDSISYPVSENAQTKIFLFTIEFSNHPDTFYKFREYSNDKIYYDKTVTGNSNVYKNLSFSLDSLLIQKK